LTVSPFFLQMDYYSYCSLGVDGWLCCARLYCPSFTTLLRDVLCHFGYTESPSYYNRLYREFRHGHCEVHMAWSTLARGDDMDDTLERATQQALMEFCEQHL
jgi:hypothetical protein